MLRRPADTIIARVLPSEAYTAMDPANPVEALPAALVRGMYLSLCWTPADGQEVNAADRFEIVDSATGKTVRDLKNDGSWNAAKTGNVYVKHVATGDMAPGEYRVRYVRGSSGAVMGTSERVTVGPPGGRFRVMKINGKDRAGDPHHITVNAGDLFEVAWDLEGMPIDHPTIYVSPPGEALRMPRADGSYAMADMYRLCRMAGDRTRRMYVSGRLTWKTQLDAADLSANDEGMGWLSGGKDAQSPTINMSRHPGTWRLWIGQEHEPGTSAVPLTPVITVEVRGCGEV